MFNMYSQQLPADGLRDIGRGAANSLSSLSFLAGLSTAARSSVMLLKGRHDDLPLTMQYDDVKMALGQIFGKDVRHCVRRFLQHNGSIQD